MWKRIGKNGTRYWGKSGAGFLFTDGSSLLLLKRAEKGDNQGKWTGPGGKQEKCETFIDTARRETKEEIGKMPKCEVLTHFDAKDGLHQFRNYLCKVDKQFSCELSDEHSDYKWHPLSQLGKVDLHPKLREIMGRVIDRIENKMISFREWCNERLLLMENQRESIPIVIEIKEEQKE